MTKIWIEDAALRDKVQRLVAELNLSLAPDGRLVDYQVGPAGKLEVASGICGNKPARLAALASPLVSAAMASCWITPAMPLPRWTMLSPS